MRGGAFVAGAIITTCLSNVKHVHADQYWLITRAGQDVPGLSRHSKLAPSRQLFNRYWRQWRGQDPATWWPTYAAAFRKELQTDEKLQELRTLYSAVQAGQTIALVCYCPDARHCHRRLVGEFLAQYGVEVSEAQAPLKPVQLMLDL